MKLEIVSKAPAADRRPTTLVFVHGMFHTASCWDVHCLDWFARSGFTSYALNLRGHGASAGRESLRWTRIADFVDDVETTVRQIPGPVVLIGHSLGGFVVQKYLEKHDAAGGVLLSSPPPTGLWRTVLRVARRRPLVFARCMLTLDLSPMTASPALAREAFYSADFPDDLLRTYWESMQPESYMAFLDMVALDLPKRTKVKTPLLVLGADRDNMIGRGEIEATARAYHAQGRLVPGVAHNSMLELHWERVAEEILRWLRDRGL